MEPSVTLLTTTVKAENRRNGDPQKNAPCLAVLAIEGVLVNGYDTWP